MSSVSLVTRRRLAPLLDDDLVGVVVVLTRVLVLGVVVMVVEVALVRSITLEPSNHAGCSWLVPPEDGGGGGIDKESWLPRRRSWVGGEYSILWLFLFLLVCLGRWVNTNTMTTPPARTNERIQLPNEVCIPPAKGLDVSGWAGGGSVVNSIDI